MKKCGRSDEAVFYMNKASGFDFNFKFYISNNIITLISRYNRMDPNNAQIKSMLEKTEQSIETTQDETIQHFNNVI